VVVPSPPWSWPNSQQPTNEFRLSIEALELELGAFQKRLRELRERLQGRYEADVAAAGLALLCLEFAWGSADLARLGLNTLAAAAACARGALETAAKAAWLVAPDEPMDREGRWLGWYRAMERYYSNLATDLSDSAEVAEEMRSRASRYGAYRSAVAEKMPDGHEIAPPPTMDRLFASLDALPLYTLYRTTSQYQHGEPLALNSVLRIVDTAADPDRKATIFRSVARKIMLGPLETEIDWLVPLSAAANSLALCGEYVFGRAGATASELEDIRASYHNTRERLTALGTLHAAER
jgi:hypothetical protein